MKCENPECTTGKEQCGVTLGWHLCEDCANALGVNAAGLARLVALGKELNR